MAESRVASRYVKSLLGLAVEQNALEEVHNDMQLFAEVCRGNREFEVVLKSPVIKHNLKASILKKIFKGKVHSLTMAIFDILTRKNREPLLPAIAREFHTAYNIHKDIQTASITTTFEVDKALRAEIEGMVKKLSGKKSVELVEKIDEELIGGFILNVGDRQIDASLKNKLKRLKVKFSQNPYLAEIKTR